MKKVLLAIATVAMTALTGCASLVDGNSQSLSFSSNPDGATVYMNGNAIGKTPVTISAKRKGSSQPLRFTKEGYKDVEIQLISTINPWIFGNVVIGGLLGSTTDGLSGAAFKYEPGSYMVTLPPASESPSDATSLNGKQQLVNFIVAGYPSLAKELSTQSGEYVTSLMTLAKVDNARRADVTQRLKALSLAYPNIPDFAEKASDMLMGTH